YKAESGEFGNGIEAVVRVARIAQKAGSCPADAIPVIVASIAAGPAPARPEIAHHQRNDSGNDPTNTGAPLTIEASEDHRDKSGDGDEGHRERADQRQVEHLSGGQEGDLADTAPGCVAHVVIVERFPA